ncbi:hypothetical protein XANCAGTX0491_002037 [Xanthoria calcicola]
MLTTLFLFGALASVISLASVVLASPFPNGEARISAALHQNTIDPDTPHRTASATLKPRYDYEPGDQLKRTMCFCTSDNSLEQVDNDPFVFKNVSVEHQMGMYYKFEYYNHRNWFTVSDQKTCHTEPGGDKDFYWHNYCLKWDTQNHDYCSRFTVDAPPAGIVAAHDWEFCYKFRGDSLATDEDTKDEFTFATDKRDLPRTRDMIAAEAEVDATCTDVCQGTLGLDLFKSKIGGWFSRLDSFHHFDDICGDDEACKQGPGHVNGKHPPPKGTNCCDD